MTADIELLPLPSGWSSLRGGKLYSAMQDYARANVAHATAAKDAEIERLRAEVERLRELCGCAYQMAGYHDAPVEWLDALGDAGDGTPLDEWSVQAKDLSDVLLPYQPDNSSHENAEIERLRAAVEEIPKPGTQRMFSEVWSDPEFVAQVEAEKAETQAAIDAAREADK